MASHLVRDGHEVVVVDQRSEAFAAIEPVGGTGVESAQEVGKRATVILLSLPGPQAVNTVVADLESTLNRLC
ncbi:NAD(P)-binding domain-containing protein [Natronorarus salvus]|uniref:NAD(P)-binding domain-containing protein n=1 Tax=Natronorarus salvus TaxID=3117733 RepID=UPI002F264C4B